jgi:hypothetical protein
MKGLLLATVLLATALAAGCSPTGFAIDVTVTADSCVAAATKAMSVLVTPMGEATVNEGVEAPFFGPDGTRRVVVVPRDGTPSLRLEVRVYADLTRKIEIERAAQSFMVQGNQILDGQLQMACPFEDMTAPQDMGIPDGAGDGPRDGASDGPRDGASDLRSSDGPKDLSVATKG